MEFPGETALTSAGATVAHRLNSKLQFVRKTLQVHHDSCLDSRLDYQVVENGDTSIITMAGTVDVTVASELHELLIDCVARKLHIIVCMPDVLHFDSAGAATILEAYATARSHALGLVLVAVSLNARHTIKLCYLDQVLPMCEDTEEAQQHIRRLRDIQKTQALSAAAFHPV